MRRNRNSFMAAKQVPFFYATPLGQRSRSLSRSLDDFWPTTALSGSAISSSYSDTRPTLGRAGVTDAEANQPAEDESKAAREPFWRAWPACKECALIILNQGD